MRHTANGFGACVNTNQHSREDGHNVCQEQERAGYLEPKEVIRGCALGNFQQHVVAKATQVNGQLHDAAEVRTDELQALLAQLSHLQELG